MKKIFFLITMCIIMCSLIACSSGSKKPSLIAFEQTILENTVARHPNIADINADGHNDLVLVTDYVDENGRDQDNIKQMALFLGPDMEKHILASLNYRACDMELGDLDGDGDPDIVGRAAKGLKEEENAMNFWLENPRPEGNPATDEWKRHPIGRTLYVKDIEVGDFNGDWKPDVVVRTNAKVHVWIQETPDSWKEKSMDIHDHEGMHIGDLDGDPDVVLNGFWLETPEDPLNAEWLEHNIDEKWWNQKTGKWMDNNCRVRCVDMNRDGSLDVLLSNSEKPGYPVSWYEAKDPKNGPWTEHVIGQIDYCHTAVPGDMDNDGDLDVVAGELIHGTDPDPDGPHPVVVFINEGDALNWKKQELSTTGVYAAELGDLDDDADLDIVGSRNFRHPPLYIWKNLMSDQISEKARFEHSIIDDDPEVDHTYIGIADINRDGKPDILGFKGQEHGFISWYEYPGYQKHIMYRGPFHSERPHAADIDSDGDLDLLVAKGPERIKDAYWYENPLPGSDPKSTWTEHYCGKTEIRIKDYGVDDFDGDGKLDLVFAGYEGTCIFFQDDKDSWTRKYFDYENGHEGADVGDIDGDGDPDVVLNGRWFETPSDPRTGPYLEHEIDEKWHNQTGTWQKNSTMVQVSDIDGNGKMDVVISHSEWPGYPVSWYSAENPKEGPWIEHKIDGDFGWCQTLKVGDVDNDGDLDVLAGRFERAVERKYDYWLSDPPYAIRIYYNDGTGLNWSMQQVSTFGIYNGQLADIGNDGDLDIVGPRSYWRGPISLWENKLK